MNVHFSAGFHPALPTLAAIVLDQLQERGEVNRLGKVGIGGERWGLGMDVLGGGYDNHGNAGKSCVSLLCATKCRAVHHRHHHVQENEFWQRCMLLQLVECGQAMGEHSRPSPW